MRQTRQLLILLGLLMGNAQAQGFENLKSSGVCLGHLALAPRPDSLWESLSSTYVAKWNAYRFRDCRDVSPQLNAEVNYQQVDGGYIYLVTVFAKDSDSYQAGAIIWKTSTYGHVLHPNQEEAFEALSEQLVEVFDKAFDAFATAYARANP